MSDLTNELSMPAPAGAPGAVVPARAEAVLSLLREDVEAAGKATRSVRLGANVATLGLLFAGAPAIFSQLTHTWLYTLASHEGPQRLLVVGTAAAVLGGQGIATFAASMYRRLRAEHLRRRLGMFTPEQQVAALQPLENAARQETREIVAPLLRLARAESAAITPAEPP